MRQRDRSPTAAKWQKKRKNGDKSRGEYFTQAEVAFDETKRRCNRRGHKTALIAGDFATHRGEPERADIFSAVCGVTQCGTDRSSASASGTLGFGTVLCAKPKARERMKYRSEELWSEMTDSGVR